MSSPYRALSGVQSARLAGVSIPLARSEIAMSSSGTTTTITSNALRKKIQQVTRTRQQNKPLTRTQSEQRRNDA